MGMTIDEVKSRLENIHAAENTLAQEEGRVFSGSFDDYAGLKRAVDGVEAVRVGVADMKAQLEADFSGAKKRAKSKPRPRQPKADDIVLAYYQVASGPRSIEQASKQLEITRDRAVGAVERLMAAGRLVKEARGLYKVAA